MKAHQLVDFLVQKDFIDFAQWVAGNSTPDTPTVDVIRSTNFSQRGELTMLVLLIFSQLEKLGHDTFYKTFVMREDALREARRNASAESNPLEVINAHNVYRDKVALLIADAIGFLYGDPERIVYEEENK